MDKADYGALFRFKGHDLADLVDEASDADLDRLPLGLVKLDAQAKILRYNRIEGVLTGRDPKAVIGKNFFLDLAACGVGPLFWGSFQARHLEARL